MHKSKIIGNFFQENEWRVLEWPAYSPDLSPIENLLAILKQLVEVFEEMERDLKKYKNLSSDKRSLMFWGAKQSDGRKLLVKCPKESKCCRLFGNFENLRRKNPFPGHYFSTR